MSTRTELAARVIAETWATMRDELRERAAAEGDALVIQGPQDSPAQIAEHAHKLAGVLFTHADWARATGYLAPAGALATLAGAARLLVAGQPEQAGLLAVLAADIFDVWAHGPRAARDEERRDGT
jgi:hypothetical protein